MVGRTAGIESKTGLASTTTRASRSRSEPGSTVQRARRRRAILKADRWCSEHDDDKQASRRIDGTTGKTMTAGKTTMVSKTTMASKTTTEGRWMVQQARRRRRARRVLRA